MDEEDHNLLISEVEQFIDKRIEIRKVYKELLQHKKNIIYLKKKNKQNLIDEFELDKGKLIIRKFKSEFLGKLNKEFSKIPIEEKRKLYKSGLLKVLFRLNYLEYEKIKKENKKNILDDYIVKRNDDESYSWSFYINEKTKQDLDKYEKTLEEETDIKKIQNHEKRQEELNKDYLEQKIENEKQFYQELAKEISLDSSNFTDDSPYDLEETPENVEKGIYSLVFDEEEDEDDK
jgi:hypothetical protein